ncbi:MAG: hypothetical protein C0592_02120 [Marinilabiliales bacterium]|nr:MAG: hypothetical protein C0592_02120 [Marinilabiliales bacterium]
MAVYTSAQSNNAALEKQIDFIIEENACLKVEFPEIYDSLAYSIPDDSTESLVIVQILKEKGFVITNWGRGNHPRGPRIISITMVKEDCECVVSKLYYSTNTEGMYEMTEWVKCCGIE